MPAVPGPGQVLRLLETKEGAMVDRTGERELLDAEQVAAMLGMTSDWVYEQSRKGRIPTITLGRYRRYRRDAIEEWLRHDKERSGARTRA